MDGLVGLAAEAGDADSLDVTLGAWAWVALHGAWMCAVLSSFLLTRGATGMGYEVPLVFWIPLLATKAIVIW